MNTFSVEWSEGPSIGNEWIQRIKCDPRRRTKSTPMIGSEANFRAGCVRHHYARPIRRRVGSIRNILELQWCRPIFWLNSELKRCRNNAYRNCNVIKENILAWAPESIRSTSSRPHTKQIRKIDISGLPYHGARFTALPKARIDPYDSSKTKIWSWS